MLDGVRERFRARFPVAVSFRGLPFLGFYSRARVATAVGALAVNAVFASVERRWELGLMVLASIPTIVDGLRDRRHEGVSPLRPLLIDITGAGLIITLAGLAPVAVAYTFLIATAIAVLVQGRGVVILHGYLLGWMTAALAVASVFNIEPRWTTQAALAFTVLHVVITLAVIVVLVNAIMNRLGATEHQRNRLVAGFTHDLKNTLTGAVGIAQLLSDHVEDLEPSEVVEYAGIVLSDGREAVAMTEDLLAVVRIEAGQLNVASEHLDLTAEITRVLESTGDLGKIPIRFGDGATATGCNADPVRVRQIIRNLVSNAHRYGGEQIHIEISSSPGSGSIQVRDDGPPIPDKDRERIFQPYQAAVDSPRHVESVGLGLSISRQLARLMGGDLTYRHTNGWAIFDLALPAITRRQADPTRPTAETITTRVEQISIGEDGILRTRILPDASIDLEDARQGVEAYKRLAGGTKRPIVISADNLTFLTRAARDHYMRSNAAAECISAAALVVESNPVARAIINHANRFGKPPFPTRVFADHTEAATWLRDMSSTT